MQKCSMFNCCRLYRNFDNILNIEHFYILYVYILACVGGFFSVKSNQKRTII